MKTAQIKIPPPVEWDFRDVTEGQLYFVITWEYARTSDAVREKLLAWLDGNQENGVTNRQRIKNGEGPLTTEEFFSLSQVSRNYVTERPVRPLNLQEDYRMVVDGQMGYEDPPDAKIKHHVFLNFLLDHAAKEFPKPWAELSTKTRRSITTNAGEIRPMPMTWKPAPNPEAEQITRDTELVEKMKRSYLVEVDPNATEGDFLKACKEFFQDVIAGHQRKVSGTPSKLPFSKLTDLAAYRWRRVAKLTARQCRAMIDLYRRPGDAGCKIEAAECGILDYVPSQREFPLTFMPLCDLPRYADDGGYSDAISRAEKALTDFKASVL